MKKKLPILMTQKFNQTTGLVSSVQKKAVFFMSLLILLMLLSFKGFAQTDGDYRSLKTGGGWASTGTWEVYFASHDIWVSTTTSAWVASTVYNVGVVRTNGGNLYEVVAAGTTAASGGPTGTGTGIVDGTVTWDYLGLPPAVAPSATTNVYIQDGVAQTSNGSGFVAGSITVGQGNAFSGTAVLTGNTVTSVTINNSGALMSAPGLTFLGAGTTLAAGTVTFKMMGAFYRNKGAGYTTATVTVGTAWTGNVAVTTTTQRTNGGNLYTCTTAGTTAASGGPTGTGTGITDGSAVWSYAGIAPTAHATIDAGKISGIVVDNAGGGYLTFPTLTITGDGAGAVYAIQMGIDNITITAGGNYTVAPQVIYGSYFTVGNSTNQRIVTVSGNVTFKNGSNLVSGAGSVSEIETLNIGGNLTAESPVSFTTVVPASTSSTTVNFTQKHTATISGAGSMAFSSLNISDTTTLVNNGTITISGTTNFHDILGFNFATPLATGTLSATNHTVALTVPGGTNVTALVPTITLRAGTTVSPLSAVAQDFTNPVTYTTTAPGGTVTQAWTVTVTVAPVAPNAKAATAVTSTGFTANWDPAATATGYRLDVATDNAFTSMVTGFSDKDVANVTTFDVTGLTAGTTYYYRVKAYNTVTGTNSNVITVSTTSASVPVTAIVVTGAGSATTITSNGGTLQMSAAVIPANATNKNVTWSVTNGTGQATIDATTGLLTASKNGIVTVKATAADGSGIVGTLDITISGQTVVVTGVTVTGTGGATTITTKGGTLQMVATIAPTDATNKNVTWSVTNGTGQATISTGGLLTASKDGTVTVTATAADGSSVSGQLVITISNQSTGINMISSKSLEIYPNPVLDAITMDGASLVKKFEVISLSGKILVQGVNSADKLTINVSNLTPGIYLLKVYTAEGGQQVKFLKK